MKLRYLFLALAGASLLASCESDDPSLVVAEYKQPTSFVLNTPEFYNGVYELINAKSVNFTFTQPDYGYSAVCDYTVEVAKDENFTEGETAMISTVYHVCDINVDANDFAMAVCSIYGWGNQEDVDAALNASAEGTIPVYVRIHSKINNSLIEGSEITSNSVSINVIPYFALAAVELPAQVYMIGDFCNWDWGNAVELVPVNSTPEKFWCIRYVEAGKGFKFSNVNSWVDGSNFGYSSDVTFTTTVDGLSFGDDGSGNIALSESGWYVFGVTVTISGRDYVYALDVFPPDVYVYGTCTGFGDNGWTDMPEWKFDVPTTAEGDFVSPALAATGEIRICVHPLLANGAQWGGDWWHTEFVYFDNKIAYRGNGGDQDRVTANAGEKIYLNFATGKAEAK